MTVRIEGMKPILRKLHNLEDLKKVIPAFKSGAVHIMGAIKPYAPATKANSPSNPTGRWYERGYGPRWKRKRKGGIGGRKTSETLGRKWTIASRNRGFTQIVGNNVSYGPYVQSEEKQAKIHGQRGWKTDQQVIDEEQDTVLDFVKDRVDRILES